MNEPHCGLTTTKAPFIEKAQKDGQIFIHQPYELYSRDNQEAWRKLYAMLLPKWERFANSKFLQGIASLCLKPDRIPTLDEVNQFLEPLTGFQAKAVSGYVPTFLFFDSLKRREFPTTVTIRDSQTLHYLPEPDIFHDIAGHVPMHTDRTFADILVKFGSLAEMAAKRHEKENIAKTRSNIQALARFFWFTIEFGLMRENGRLCVYGSGLLSSANEIEHAVVSKEVQRFPFQLEWAINQSFEIDKMQPLLFIVESFSHLYEEVERLEEWLLTGKLDNVSFGEPKIQDDDLQLFLSRGQT
ncbi:MAG TPA: phenylalanine 4-monooxygenase [Chlamydiales bacterium]|nr:phenylalanine 4-monooxygenase [Chlamydiales bacterium]